MSGGRAREYVPQVLMLGGEHTFVVDWWRAASEITRADLGVISPSFSPWSIPSLDRESGRVRIPTFLLRPKRLFWRFNEVWNARALRLAMDLLEKDGRKVDLLHTHFFSMAGGAVRLSRKQGVALCHTEHSSRILGGHLSTSGKKFLLRTCCAAGIVFAVSEALANAMREYGVRRSIEVVPNPVFLDLFEPIDRRGSSSCSGEVRFVSVGALRPRKDHATLLRAFAQVGGRLRQSRLYLIGEGPLREGLERLSEDLGIHERVIFFGAVSRGRVAELLGLSDVYVHSSRYETFGVALVEAWAAGLPVVTFDCGGVSSFTEELGGSIIQERDSVRLGDGMLREARRNSWSRRKAIQERAREIFERRKVEEALRCAYQNIRAS